jgi:hypothetical protein
MMIPESSLFPRSAIRSSEIVRLALIESDAPPQSDVEEGLAYGLNKVRIVFQVRAYTVEERLAAIAKASAVRHRLGALLQ